MHSGYFPEHSSRACDHSGSSVSPRSAGERWNPVTAPLARGRSSGLRVRVPLARLHLAVLAWLLLSSAFFVPRRSMAQVAAAPGQFTRNGDGITLQITPWPSSDHSGGYVPLR